MSRGEALFTSEGRLRQECFSLAALRALRAACDAAMRTGWPTVRTPHLFIGLLEEADEAVVRWLDHNQLDGSRLRQNFLELFDMSQQLQTGPIHLHRAGFSQHLLEVLQFAYQRAVQRGGLPVTTADLLAAVFLCEPSVVAECLRRDGYDVSLLLRHLPTS